MNFERLSAGHWVAGVASLLLLLAMAADWYGTAHADSLRRDEGLIVTDGTVGGEIGRTLARDIPPVAEGMEQNAWQAYLAPDLGIVVLALLLAAVGAGLFAACARAADRRVQALGGASSIAAGAALAAILAVVLRLIDQPGSDGVTTVRGGAFLGLFCLALLAVGASRAIAVERAEPAPGVGAGAGGGSAPVTSTRPAAPRAR